MFWARAVTASSMKVSALRVYRSMRNQADTGAASTEVEANGWQEALLHRTKEWNDAAFANGAALVLFLLAAWPLLLTEVPPYQDVPNHLASATVIANPDQYPEYVFNGFFKTNSALFAWMLGLGRFLGFRGALKVFTALVLAANAVIIPHFVLQARGRRTVLVATLFAWPLVHNWFVCMGMLDFALAVPLSFLLLMLLERRLHHPTWSNALAIAGLGLATWYAHVFPVMVVLLLVGVRVLGQLWAHLVARPSTVRHPWRGALHELMVLVGPLLPVVALVLRSFWVQVSEPQGALKAVTQDQRFLPAWEFLYNAWAEYLYNFTYYSAPTALIALCLVYFAWTFRRRSRSEQAAGFLGANSRRPEHSADRFGLEGDLAESAPSSTAFGGFLSGGAVAVLGLLYVLVPYSVTHWYHVNSRFLAYLWLAALVRVPERISRGFAGLVAVAALVNSLGLGLDFKRLDGETKAFSAGIPAVPEGARLLPLIFKHKDLSDNTRNLVHLWGLYVEEKHTSAPLLFAHSYSFPVTHREPPAPRFHELRLEGFANLMASPERFCTGVQLGGMSASECKALWIREWGDFWQDAQPRFNYVLTWDMPTEVEAHLPSALQSVFRQGKLGIYRFAEESSAEGSSPEGKQAGAAPTGLTP